MGGVHLEQHKGKAKMTLLLRVMSEPCTIQTQCTLLHKVHLSIVATSEPKRKKKKCRVRKSKQK